MFALSLTSLVLILIVGYVFRRTIKQATNIAPQIANDALTMAAVGSAYAKDLVYINEAESRIELQQRAKIVADTIATNGNSIINIEQLAATVRNGQ